MKACAFVLSVAKVAEYGAVPNPASLGGGLFTATDEPRIVAATATVMSARIRNC